MASRAGLGLRNTIRISGLLHAEQDSVLRATLRYPTLSLCGGLVLLGLGSLAGTANSLERAARLVAFWVGLAACYWAAFQWLFRRIFLKARDSGDIRRPKAEIEDLTKFSNLLTTAGGISIVLQQQYVVFWLPIMLNIIAGLVFADFSGELYAQQSSEQNIVYVTLNRGYYDGLRSLVSVQFVSLAFALLGLIVAKGGFV
jgi:hypothetical protein